METKDGTQQYEINKKRFFLQNDFTFEDLEWLDVVFGKLNSNPGTNEITGAFTREEIKKTLKILLKDIDGNEFTDKDYRFTRESLSVKIIADFFLSKAILGAIIKSSSTN